MDHRRLVADHKRMAHLSITRTVRSPSEVDERLLVLQRHVRTGEVIERKEPLVDLDRTIHSHGKPSAVRITLKPLLQGIPVWENLGGFVDR